MLVQLFNLALALLDWSHSFKGTFPMIPGVSGIEGRGGKLLMTNFFSSTISSLNFLKPETTNWTTTRLWLWTFRDINWLKNSLLNSQRDLLKETFSERKLMLVESSVIFHWIYGNLDLLVVLDEMSGDHPKLVRFILWGPWTSVANYTAIHQVFVEICCSTL